MCHEFLSVAHSISGNFVIRKKCDTFSDKHSNTITRSLIMTKYFRPLRVFILFIHYTKLFARSLLRCGCGCRSTAEQGNGKENKKRERERAETHGKWFINDLPTVKRNSVIDGHVAMRRNFFLRCKFIQPLHVNAPKEHGRFTKKKVNNNQ